MTSLPAELESLVCSFLSIADLKAARQVNKRWAHISASFLFEELWITQPTLQKLEDISCHKTLRFHVKMIVIHILPVPIIPQWAWKVKDQLNFMRKNPEKLAVKFPRYKFLYDEQQRFASSDVGVTTMRRAVDKLPQLLCLEGRAMPPPEQRRQYFLPPLGSPGYWDDHEIYKYVQKLNSIGDVKDAEKYIGDTLRGLFQTRSGLKIKHFIPGFLYSQSITKPNQLMPGIALPEHLQALEVHVRFCDWVNEHMSGLQNTLSKTRCLKRLLLDVGPRRTYDNSDILEGFRPSLPKLEHLAICGGHTTEYSLTALLTQIIGNLRSLRLDMVSLVDPPPGQQSTSWSQVLSIFLSEEGRLARITLTDLSYFHPDDWSKTWLTAQCLLSIRDAISYKAALPENEAYDDKNCAQRQGDKYVSGPLQPLTICWEMLQQSRSDLAKERRPLLHRCTRMPHVSELTVLDQARCGCSLGF